MLLDTKMATKKQPTHVPVGECTEFTVYVKQKGVADFTEGRLRKLLEKEQDVSMRSSLKTLFDGYIKGELAVAFNKGQPVYIKATKNK